MTKTFKILGTFIIGLVLGLGGIVLAYSGGSPKVVVEGDYLEASEQSLGGVTYDEEHFNGDVYAHSTLTVDGVSTLTGAVGIAGLLSTERFVEGGAWKSTSTSATALTLVEGDLLNYKGIEGTFTSAMTYTLPASSTLTSFIPNAGDKAYWYIQPITSAVTIAAGTGIDLMRATTTLTVAPNDIAEILFIRQSDTDIYAMFSPFNDAD